MKRIGILSVTFAAMLAVACEGRRDNDVNRPANDTAAVGTAGERTAAADRDLSGTSRTWLEDMIAGNMSEVKLGETAEQKAQSPEVKAFAQMLVRDHSMAVDQLKEIASKHNVTAPVELPDAHRDTMERLSKVQGGEFDRDFMNAMVDKHEKTLGKLEDRLDKEGDNDNPIYLPKKTDNAADMELNQWAAKMVPTVRQHLERARQLDQKLERSTTDAR